MALTRRQHELLKEAEAIAALTKLDFVARQRTGAPEETSLAVDATRRARVQVKLAFSNLRNRLAAAPPRCTVELLAWSQEDLVLSVACQRQELKF
jgi:hypothetical protein